MSYLLRPDGEHVQGDDDTLCKSAENSLSTCEKETNRKRDDAIRFAKFIKQISPVIRGNPMVRNKYAKSRRLVFFVDARIPSGDDKY